MADTTTDALVNAMNAQSERSVLGQFGTSFGALYGSLGFEEARRVRDSAHTDEELAEGFGHVSERISDSAGVLGVQAEKIGAATSLAVEKVGNQSRTDALTFANQASVQALTFFNATQVAIEKTAAAAILDSTKNAAAIAAQVAECCCEIKELVRAENGATRDLITANRIRELELQLASIPRGIAVTLPPVVIG